jgi:hypothetical protein
MKRNLLILIGIVTISALAALFLRESFYNIKPTELIDPEYRYPVAVEFDPKWPSSQSYVPLYERVGDNHGVDLACHNVSLPETAQWIARDDPRLMYEAVLRFDPSVNPYNPDHAPRVLRLLMMNLPSYGCQETVDKYLPIVRKCFPAQIRV